MIEGVKYRAAFLTRPDLDSDDFKDYTGRIEIGLEIEKNGETWRVVELVTKQGDDRETIVLEPVR
jgi:hypothetical protein